jgi:hypothetical protein
MNKTTINDAIHILQDAVKIMGGDTTFICFNGAGDKDYPTGWDTNFTIKGNKEFEEVYLF